MKAEDSWKEYEERVQALEQEGCTRSDAQSIVDMKFEQEGKTIN